MNLGEINNLLTIKLLVAVIICGVAILTHDTWNMKVTMHMFQLFLVL